MHLVFQAAMAAPNCRACLAQPINVLKRQGDGASLGLTNVPMTSSRSRRRSRSLDKVLSLSQESKGR